MSRDANGAISVASLCGLAHWEMLRSLAVRRATKLQSALGSISPIDLGASITPHDRPVHLVECESGATIHPSFLQSLVKLMEKLDGGESTGDARPVLVYGGSESHPSRRVPIYSWSDVDRLGERMTN